MKSVAAWRYVGAAISSGFSSLELRSWSAGSMWRPTLSSPSTPRRRRRAYRRAVASRRRPAELSDAACTRLLELLGDENAEKRGR